MFKKLLLAACLGLTLGACNESEEKTGLPNNYVWATFNPCIEEGRFTGRNMHFYGTSTVVDAQGGEYVDRAAYFEFAGSDNRLTLYMHNTRFAAAMPPVRMSIPRVPYTGSGNAIGFEAAEVIPEAFVPNLGYQPVERYLITDLDGSVEDIDCRVEFTCAGIYRVRFEGRQIVGR